jgi:hypothetical protein
MTRKTTPEFDEQTERILENLAEYHASAPYEFTMQEFEDIFEDRDPFEFL